MRTFMFDPPAQISSKGLHRSQQPMEAYRLLKFFLLLWKSVELIKTDWGRRKLGVESIANTTVYREFWSVYQVICHRLLCVSFFTILLFWQREFGLPPSSVVGDASP